MKNILMYTTNKIYTGERITGGIKRFIMLYQGLIDKGYNVDLYCAETQETLKKYNMNAKSINCENKRKSRIFPNVIIMVKNIKLLLKLKKEKYDKVIVFDVPTAISICLLKFKNINLFLRQDLIEYRKIILDNSNKNKIYKIIYLKFMELCEYICCKNSEKIIVQCKFDLENLMKRHRFIRKSLQKKTIVQINNVNARWIIEKSKINVNVETNGHFKIGFVGDFSSKRKGHNLLIPAICKLIEKEIDVELFVIGDGRELDSYQATYKQYENINFLGKMTNPMEIVKRMDLVVVPSLADSCPNTVLEAMYNDILVIGTNKGGIPEIIDNNQALFEPTIDSLEKKLIEIISNFKYKKDLKDKQQIRKKQLTFEWEDRIIEILKN